MLCDQHGIMAEKNSNDRGCCPIPRRNRETANAGDDFAKLAYAINLLRFAQLESIFDGSKLLPDVN